MKTLGRTVVMLLCYVFPAQAQQVLHGCVAPPSTFGKIWYVDAVNGKPPAGGGDGSQAHPWNSLTGIAGGQWTNAGFTVPGYTRPLLSSVPYYHRIATGYANVADTLGSPPIKPGDEILLMSGNYGDIYICAHNAEISNPAFVTVAAAPGQKPVLTSLFLCATNMWAFNGLKVQSLQSAALSNLALVEVKDQGASYPTSNIVFENMTISSQDDVSNWTQAQSVGTGARVLSP